MACKGEADQSDKALPPWMIWTSCDSCAVDGQQETPWWQQTTERERLTLTCHLGLRTMAYVSQEHDSCALYMKSYRIFACLTYLTLSYMSDVQKLRMSDISYISLFKETKETDIFFF